MASRRPPSRRTADAGTRDLEALVRESLPADLPRRRWFASKGRRLVRVSLLDAGAFAAAGPGAWLALVEAAFAAGPPEVYHVPLLVRGEALLDALEDAAFCRALFEAIEREARVPTRKGEVRFSRTGSFPVPPPGPPSATRLTAEQSNTSVVFDDALILKAFRKIEPGINPDREVTAFLTTRTQFRHIPLLAGAVDYSGAGGLEATLGVLQRFVANQGDGWTYTQDHLRRFVEFAASRPGLAEREPGRLAQLVREFSAGLLLSLRRLGELTGRLHAALASDAVDPAFRPEPISAGDVARWRREIEEHVGLTLGMIRARLPALPERLRVPAEAVVAHEAALRGRAGDLEGLRQAECVKIRVHGDYHLGQTLRTADDFVIFDFEGEPARPLARRREKLPALKDAAGMLRSLDYAAAAALRERAGAEPDAAGSLEVWGNTWTRVAARSFLDGYATETARAAARLVPAASPALARALAVYEMDKALYEVRYEVDNRPAWLPIPLRGLSGLLGGRADAAGGGA